MLSALIIVFREVIEAGLIVGIVLAVTRGVAGRGFWTALGLIGGLLGAGIVAFFADMIASSMAGSGQELMNAGILGFAVVMLATHNVWMARHGRELAADMRAVGAAVANGTTSLAALAIVIGVAVLREGSEVVLFLYGPLIAGDTSASEVLAGGGLGLVLGALLSAATYLGLVTIPARALFGVTTTLINLIAAGLAAQAVAFLQQAGLAPLLQDTAWDTSAILSDSSLLGRVLHTLVGYTDQPSGLQVVAYVVTLLAIALLTRASRRPVMPARPMAAPAIAE